LEYYLFKLFVCFFFIYQNKQNIAEMIVLKVH